MLTAILYALAAANAAFVVADFANGLYGTAYLNAAAATFVFVIARSRGKQ